MGRDEEVEVGEGTLQAGARKGGAGTHPRGSWTKVVGRLSRLAGGG